MGGYTDPNQTLRDVLQAQEIIEQRIYELRNGSHISTNHVITISKLSVLAMAISLVAKSKLI